MSSTRLHATRHRGHIDPATAQTVVASLDVAVLLVDAHDGIIYRNEAADASVPAGDTLPSALANLRILGPFDGWESTLNRVRSSGERVRLQCTMTAGGAADRSPESIRCLPVNAEVGGISGAVLVVIDADQLSNGQSPPNDVARHLATLDGLAARVAHELNNPLDAVLRYLNLALSAPDTAVEPKLRDYLKHSHTGVVRMMRIISDMLRWARGTELHSDDTRVDEIVREAVEAHAEAVRRADIVIDINHDANVATVEEGDRLFHVVSNLIGNAIDAMTNGGRLTISTTMDGTDLVITVADTGIGLPADARQLFEPFFTTKPPHGGTGLGLAICKDFVVTQGGAIDARPGDNGGAVFVVRWPRARPAANSAARGI